jgi:ribosomal protein S18 acetylase RimI-like enzyme
MARYLASPRRARNARRRQRGDKAPSRSLRFAASRARIRRVRESDLVAFRRLRLDALRTDPSAFGSTFERESAYDERLWRDRIHRSATSADVATWVAEAEGGGLVGLVGALAHEGVVDIFGMWVRPEFRGRGIGSRLLAALLRWTRASHRDLRVRLSVNPMQDAAVRLYRRRGFEATGGTEPLAHTPGAIAEEMVLRTPP